MDDIQLVTESDSLRKAFGATLLKLANKYDFLVVDHDIAGGTCVDVFRDVYPDRFIQAGISEQNGMGVAAGLAASLGIPIFYTGFAMFTLRAYEIATLSVAYSNRNVKIVVSHPSLDTGPDGASCQPGWDLAAWRAVPNMTIISPCDQIEVELVTEAILQIDTPVYMRTGRSAAPRILNPTEAEFTIGHGSILREGDDVTVIACGVEVARALVAAEILDSEGIKARVVNMSTIKPIDAELIKRCAVETGAIVTAEDHNILGGLGSAVAEAVVRCGVPCPMEFVGVRDVFGESGEPDELATKYGIDETGIVRAVLKVLKARW